MANKIRIMDLSSELGIGNKELLQILRELDIPVKSHVSSITDEEAAQVREKMQRKDASVDVQQREIQPGVILRRRKKVAKAEEVEQKDVVVDASVADQPDETSTPPVQEKAKAKQERRVTSARIVSQPQSAPKSAAGGEDAHVAPSSDEQPLGAAAELVEDQPEVQFEDQPGEQPKSESGESSEDQSEVQPEDQSAERLPKTTSADEPDATQAEVGDSTGAESEKAAVSETAPVTEEKPKKRKPKRKEPLMQTGPQVRIISKPEAKPDFSYKPESKPYTPTPVQTPGSETPARAAVPKAAPSTESTQERKKKKKGKRTVEIVQTSPFAEQDRSDPNWKKKKTSPVQDRTGGKFRTKRSRSKSRDAHDDQMLQTGTQPIKAAKRKIRMEEAIRVSDMAKQMGLKAQEIIKILFSMGMMTTINQSIDQDTATLVATEFGYEVEQVGFLEEGFTQTLEEDKLEDLAPRPPVVTIMGHVDHGKTSLLDAIRETNVTKGEAGGITQHIGAYHVETSRGIITFLDTPGHEAFTAMRARGAQVTDLVILVVAADDGVMEQTKEAVNHAKAANVPIVVAVNKIDKEDANPDRVIRELSEMGLLAEAWGGDTIFANVSAKQRIGLDELLEMVLLQAEVLDLKANPGKRARGHIVEARLDKGRGPVATVLIQEGSLHEGDVFVCGLYQGKVRAMLDDKGQKIKEAGPSYPVEVQGFDGLAESGDEFVVVADEKIARRIASARQTKEREKTLAKASKVTLDSFLASKAAGETKVLNLVIKTDVQGSAEAVSESLLKLSTDEVRVQIVHSGAGAITESDVMLAAASSAIVIGFNVRPMAKVKEIAESESVEIRFYDIIYNLVNDIRDAMTGMLSPIIRESYLGQAEVRQTFSVPKIGMVAGCAVMDGKLLRNAKIRLLREGVVIYTGKLSSLRRFKEDVKEVSKGFECGVGLANFNDIKVGDVIEAFEEVSEKATL
ncbi:translation initiation factor IF-2 [Desulfonatronum thiosulfatophilum]|uniref:Translation initiation factor IF-2 n=1 Tax=Desulfonatronum thiosulfatophilum TaxID=617002 RepID=A0A1G6DIR7_9BACT|nr:translation initiation factor IF-2 [Desulfonatronum thiosulfatophilum]SDB44991.1 translation initiation factor IF-2 [Desulfonatronum thiosulfatophilum]